MAFSRSGVRIPSPPLTQNPRRETPLGGGFSILENLKPGKTRRFTHGNSLSRGLLFRHFFGLLVAHFADFFLVLLEQGLHLFLALVALVFCHFIAFLGLVEVLIGVAADVA